MDIKEFKINEFLTLKLEDKKTIIYIKNQRFNECKYLLLNIPEKIKRDLNDITSIDEAEELLDHSLREQYENGDDPVIKQEIPPEVEFWGHCSNLQAWAEHGYDTRLLHRNISFHLLKRLAETGDSIALQRLKEEIVVRYNTGNETVREYLWFENFLSLLDGEEFRHLQIFEEEIDALIKLKIPMRTHTYTNSHVYSVMNLDVVRGTITELSLPRKNWKEVPASLQNFKNVKELALHHNCFTTLPSWIWKFKSLTRLNLDQNMLAEIPDEITGENSLKYLNLSENPLKTLPKSIENLTKLEEIFINKGGLEYLPESFGNLRSLKKLTINGTNLSELPESIRNLSSLEELHLERNKLKKLPDSIENFKSIKIFDLTGNKLEFLPESIGNLKTLTVLDVSFNQLISVPDSIGYLSNVHDLSLLHNKLSSIPKDFETLTSLKELDLRSNNFESLPDSLQNCISLESLWLSHNPIRDFPRWIFKMKRLSYLDIKDTNISTMYLEKVKEECNKRQIRLID